MNPEKLDFLITQMGIHARKRSVIRPSYVMYSKNKRGTSKGCDEKNRAEKKRMKKRRQNEM